MIIPLSLQDADVVEQLWSLQHIAYRLEAQAVGLTEFIPLRDTFDSMKNSDECFFGYQLDDDLIAGAIAISYTGDPHEMEITRLMVHSEYLRQGIGSALVQHVLDQYPNYNFVVIAGIHNAPAVHLYEKYRFARTHKLPAISVAGTELVSFNLKRMT